MNSLIIPPTPVFFPLNQLHPHCIRLINSLNDCRTSQKERILYEQTLWNEVKKIRALNEKSIFSYLVGYYHTILYRIAKVVVSKNNLFQYHVLIRLGDLNRYMDCFDVAEYYYCNARNLFPHLGQAYNQLGLLTNPSNCHKCCYYYARAARSSDNPLNTIADSNLRIAISKYDSQILQVILNETRIDPEQEKHVVKFKDLPKTALEWFYVIVIAVYADNLQPIAKVFLSYLLENFPTQKATSLSRESTNATTFNYDRESYIILASLDILLDWLKLGTQGKQVCTSSSTELRQIRARLQAIVVSFKSLPSNSIEDNQNNTSSNNSHGTSSTIVTVLERNNSLNNNNNNNNNDTTTTSSTSNNSTIQELLSCTTTDSSSDYVAVKLPALPHDYVLQGFSPLDKVHQELQFNSRKINEANNLVDDTNFVVEKGKSFVEVDQLVAEMLLVRIKTKLDSFRPLMRKRTTRNIALESILSTLEKE